MTVNQYLTACVAAWLAFCACVILFASGTVALYLMGFGVTVVICALSLLYRRKAQA
jgi:hypothetical protein